MVNTSPRALRDAIRVHGPDHPAVRAAAIAYCEARGIDPHFRYPIYPKIVHVPLTSEAVSGPNIIKSIEEWEKIVRGFASDLEPRK